MNSLEERCALRGPAAGPAGGLLSASARRRVSAPGPDQAVERGFGGRATCARARKRKAPTGGVLPEARRAR